MRCRHERTRSTGERRRVRICSAAAAMVRVWGAVIIIPVTGSLSLWERARVREHTEKSTTATALTLTLSRYAGEGEDHEAGLSPYASVSSSNCTRIPSGSRRKALLKFPSGVLVTVGGTTKSAPLALSS